VKEKIDDKVNSVLLNFDA